MKSGGLDDAKRTERDERDGGAEKGWGEEEVRMRKIELAGDGDAFVDGEGGE